MRIRAKITISLIITAFVIVLSYCIFLIIRSQRDQLLMESYQQALESASKAAIKGEFKYLTCIVNDHSVWDEMALYSQTQDTSWSKSNLSAIRIIHNLSGICILDHEKKLIYAIPADNTETGFSGLFSDPFFHFAEAKKTSCFFYRENGKVYEIAISAIHPTGDTLVTTPLSGYFMISRVMDTKLFHDIEEFSGSRITLSRGPGDQKAHPGILEITSMIPLRGWNNQPVGYLEFRQSQPMLNSYLKIINITGIFYFMVALLILTIMSLVLYRWLNYPLKKIAESFSAENPQIIKSLAGKKNEFGEIALMIERFFHQKEKLAEIIKGKNEALVSLSDAESKNRIILSAISDHIFRINLFGVITDFHIKTPDELISDTQSLIGKNFETVVPAHIVPILQRAICAVNENKQTQHFDFSLIPNNPKTKYYEVTLSLTSEGGYLIVIRNISTRKQAEMALYRMLEKEADLNRLKTQFVSTVSHEFRTPLSAISSNIQLLDLYEEKWPADKKLTVFSRIKEAINQMTALLDDLSVIARDQYGKFKLAPIELNLELFCREIAEEIMATSRPGGNIQMEFLCEGAVVNMDPRLLRHIFSNLLINAVKFSAPGSPVLFKLEDQNKNLILITIQDHGIGISEEDLVNIFEPFHRGENVAGYPGTGLGLSIVKRCVNQHKGSISVMSRLTEGTTVTVVLPKKYHPGEPNGEKTL